MWFKSNKSDYAFTKIKGTRKWDDFPYFYTKKWVEEYEWKDVSGKLEKIMLWSYEYEWKTIDTFKLYMKDDQWDDDFILNLSFNSLGISIANTILWMESFEKAMTISLYQTSKWEKVYNAVSIRQGGEMQKRKLSIDEQKKLTEVIEDKKWEYIKTDKSELVEKLKEELRKVEINEKKDELFGSKKKEEKKESKAKPKKDDDLPF